MAGKNKGGREAKKPKANAKKAGPVASSVTTTAINGAPPKNK